MTVTTCMKYADATITQYYNSDEILVDLKINSLWIGFSWRLTKVQHYYSITNAFQSAFVGKVYCEACY